MLRSEIRREAEAVSTIDPVEREMKSRVLSWIDSGAPLFRVEKPAIPPVHLVCYFVLVDGDHLLLVDHIDAGLWLPTGGHVEPGEHPRAAALREVKEELGIDGRFLDERPLLLTVTETVGRTAGHTDVSFWYALSGDRGEALSFDASEFRSVRWFELDRVPLGESDPHLGRFVAKLRRLRAMRAPADVLTSKPT